MSTAVAELNEAGTHIHVDLSYVQRDLMKQVPGSAWNGKERVWRVPLGWSSCVILRSVFGAHLEVGPRLNTWAAKERAERIDPAMALRDTIELDGDPQLYPFQRAGIEFLSIAKRALLADEMGCLIGSTEVQLNRGGGTRRITLEKLHRKWTTKTGRYAWQPGVSTRIKSLMPDGQLRLNDVVDVIDKGIKPVVVVTLASGKSVTCTLDHLLATPGDDQWVRADALQPGSEVLSNGTPICKRCGSADDVILSKTAIFKGFCRDCMYKYQRSNTKYAGDMRLNRDGYLFMLRQWEHPNANNAGHVAVHVLTMSEHLGRGIADDEHVHHKNHDKLDNRLENLELLSIAEHTAHHAQDGGWLHFNGASGKRGEIWFIPKTDTVVSVEPAGEQRVYDLVMADPGRNFVANGIVVHNSGKTLQSIRTVQRLYADGHDVFPLLVVCPNSMKKTWQREAERWWPGLTLIPVGGTATQRRKQLETPAHGYVLNWEALRGHSRLAPYGSIALKKCAECGGEDSSVTTNQCQVHERELNRMNFGTVILDEAHRLKDPRSQMSRAAFAATGSAPYRFALTGTPIANAPDDLWPILHLLDDKQFPSRTRWIDRYCDVMYNAFGSPTVVGIKPEREAEFRAIVDPMMRRMPKSLVLPFLPPIVRERREVDMTPKQAKAYAQMRDLMIAELEAGDTVLATSPLTRATRLLQFSSAFAELESVTNAAGEQEVKVRLAEPSCKIDAFMDDLPDLEGKSVVVFAQSRQLIELLSAKLSKQKVPVPHGLITGAQDQFERQKHMDDFQAGKTKLILCTVQAGGTGITLTKGSVAVFLQRSWSLVDSRQAEARIHRIGSEIHESVTIIDYVTTGSVEEYQIAALEQKSERLEAVVRDADLLRRVLKGEETL